MLMSALVNALSRVLPAKQVVTDPLRRLAYGTDASFYRLIPEVVAVVESEAEVQALLQAARELNRSVTFRAAGTSLSGQSVSDSVLLLIGEGLAGCEIEPGAAVVRTGPGIIGGEVNFRLAPHGRKIGPDPASINAAKMGGIVANNASGMCCGTTQNSYRTLAGLRVILADGTLLDTEDAASVAQFRQSHHTLVQALQPGWASRHVATARWPSASATSTGSRTPRVTA
jgi:D-lactate dehydrogenase